MAQDTRRKTADDMALVKGVAPGVAVALKIDPIKRTAPNTKIGSKIITIDNRSPKSTPVHRVSGNRSLGIGAKSKGSNGSVSTKSDKKF